MGTSDIFDALLFTTDCYKFISSNKPDEIAFGLKILDFACNMLSKQFLENYSSAEVQSFNCKMLSSIEIKRVKEISKKMLEIIELSKKKLYFSNIEKISSHNNSICK